MNKPTTLEEIYGQHDFYVQRRDRARARLEAAEKTVEQCLRRTGITRMVQQLADLLTPMFPEHKLYVLGPFGLSNETSIHANDPNADDIKTVGSLSFRMDDGRLLLIDRSRDSGQYPEGSIGAVNGFNYGEVELPATVEGVAELLWASIRKGARAES